MIIIEEIMMMEMFPIGVRILPVSAPSYRYCKKNRRICQYGRGIFRPPIRLDISGALLENQREMRQPLT